MNDIYEILEKYRDDVTQYIIEEFQSYGIYFDGYDLRGGYIDPVFDLVGEDIIRYDVNKIMHLYYDESTGIEKTDGPVLVKFITECIAQFIKNNKLDGFEINIHEDTVLISITRDSYRSGGNPRVSVWWRLELFPEAQ